MNRLLSKTYYNDKNQRMMQCNFNKSSGDLEYVSIYTDERGNRKEGLLPVVTLSPTFSDEGWVDTSDLLNFSHLSIRDMRENTDLYQLDLDSTPNAGIQISVHEIKLNYNGKEVQAFYKTNGILSGGFSSGFDMLTTTKITVLESTKYNTHKY